MRAPVAAVLLACSLGCSSVELQHGLDERQANQILLTLDQAGIAADKEKEDSGREATFKIRVGRADAAQAWSVLKAHELPRERPKGLLEIFGQPSLIPTVTQERALHLGALSGELARTLETIDGVLTARVHISLPEDNPLRDGEQRLRPAASVLIKARAGTALNEDDVRRLVAGSVDGLDPTKVSVVATMSPPTPRGLSTEFATLGPFRVARSSRPALLVTLATGLLLMLGLALLLAVVALRAARALRRAVELQELGQASEHSGARASLAAVMRAAK
jgi:type III secretion protein J